jgi:hypothetical protein
MLTAHSDNMNLFSCLKRRQDILSFAGLKSRKRVLHGRVGCCAEIKHEQNTRCAVPHHKQLARSKTFLLDTGSANPDRDSQRKSNCCVHACDGILANMCGFVKLDGLQGYIWDPHVDHVRHYSFDPYTPQQCPSGIAAHPSKAGVI